MPGYDRSGPLGAGPMTGDSRGLCNPAIARGSKIFIDRYGYGGGPGFRGGFGRGISWRRGFSREYGWKPPAAGTDDAVDRTAELAALRSEADYLRNAIEAINRRIDENA